MSLHVTVASIVEQNNKFLFVEEEINGEVYLNQPAGHLEQDESLIDAVIRETMEETGWRVQPEYLVGIYLLKIDSMNRTYLRFCFYCEALEQDLHAELDREIIRTHWLSDEEFSASEIKHRSPLVKKSLEDFFSGIQHPLSILKYYEH